MAEANLPKQLKIKTGVLKRIYKEHFSYKKEEEKLREKIQIMVENNDSEGKVKQMVHFPVKKNECLNETIEIIPNVNKRLNEAYNDLENWLVSII